MGRLSRVNVIIAHLCVADLIVTFVMIPMEIVWGITIRWLASDGTCRLLSFFRAVGIYVSSFVVAVIALDRCFTVCGRTLSAAHAKRRMKVMLALAWLAGAGASVPQVHSLIIDCIRIIIRQNMKFVYCTEQSLTIVLSEICVSLYSRKSKPEGF
jgi:hypothetical protein